MSVLVSRPVCSPKQQVTQTETTHTGSTGSTNAPTYIHLCGRSCVELSVIVVQRLLVVLLVLLLLLLLVLLLLLLLSAFRGGGRWVDAGLLFLLHKRVAVYMWARALAIVGDDPGARGWGGWRIHGDK